MTTEKQDQLPRRSFLASAVAVAAGGMLAGGVVVAGAPSAAAADGATITWRSSTEAAEAKANYAALLKDMREAVREGRVTTDGGPVDVTDINGSNQYITVDLHPEIRGEFIRLVIRRSDLYLMGWFEAAETGGITLGDFFPLEASLEMGQGGIPQGRPPGTLPPVNGVRDRGSRTVTLYNTLAGYDALARQGANRIGMQLSPSSLENAVLTLSGATPRTARTVAQSILQIIVWLCEGTRFRQQAIQTAQAFGRGQVLTITSTHTAFHNSWRSLSRPFLVAIVAGAAALAAPVEIAGIVIATTAVAANYLLTAHHSSIQSRRRHISEGSFLYVHRDIGDYTTVQAAIDAVEGSTSTVTIAKGVYNEVISVPKGKSWLTIQGETSTASDVLIYGRRCHGMINPKTGTKYGTQETAVATFRPPNLTVRNLSISNLFDRSSHPEISPYETQAVAVAAMGDRQVYDNVRISSMQDTLLVKGETETAQARQYFVNCFIRGDVDFIFGNATAVIDRSTIDVLPWPGGTILAPNTSNRKKYGILISNCTITTPNVSNDTMYLGRPWVNTTSTWPQAVVRNCNIAAGITNAHPWTNMVPEQPWQYSRFKEYGNFGPGAGTGSNAPQLTATEAADYTAQKYLAGLDGWNPLP